MGERKMEADDINGEPRENFAQGIAADVVRLTPRPGDLVAISFHGPMNDWQAAEVMAAVQGLKESYPGSAFLVADDRVNLNLITLQELRMVGYLHRDLACDACRRILDMEYEDKKEGEDAPV